MRVFHAENQRVSVDLGQVLGQNGNYVDIITGPNGCGKTEVLDILIRHFTQPDPSGSLRKARVWPTVTSTHTSSKVIVQTFSPFARFPPPLVKRALPEKGSVETYLNEGNYISIGLHKNSKNVGYGLSRRILEDALFRLSGSPRGSDILFSALRGLDFDTRFGLEYVVRPGYRELFDNPVRGRSIDNFVAALREKSKTSLEIKRWEILFSSPDLLAMLDHSLEVAEQCIDITRRRPTNRHSFLIKFNIENIRRNFYVLQAFAFLRKFDLLALASCRLYSSGLDDYLDVANTSSGQQQMLCALFGLSTAIEDDCLVLLDEPELSLHPEWQLKFVDALFGIVNKVSDAHIVIATHSPLLVQRGAALGAGIIQLGEAASRQYSSSLNREPVSVEQALVDIFHTPITESTHVSNEIFQAIVRGETGSFHEKESALKRLEELKIIYQDDRGGKTTRLVHDAIRLINMPDTPPSGNEKSPSKGEARK